LFKFANKNTILDDIYPTISAFITEQQFIIYMIMQLLNRMIH